MFYLLLSMFFVAFSMATAEQSTANVDLSKYQGTWYQIADYPQLYELFFCNECTKATYTIQGPTLHVLNEARGCSITGKATIPDPTQTGKLDIKFDFLGSSGAQYWIYEVGDVLENGLYEWSIVSNENRDSCYILNRQPEMKPSVFNKVLKKMIDLGFDVTRLRRTNQTDCATAPQLLR